MVDTFYLKAIEILEVTVITRRCAYSSVSKRFVYFCYTFIVFPKPHLSLGMARLNTDPRSNESPMDWEWQHGHGPISSDSPFPQGEAISGQFYGFAGQKRQYNIGFENKTEL